MSKAEVIRAQDEETLARCLEIRGEVFTTEKGVPREIEADALDCLGGACDDESWKRRGGQSLSAFIMMAIWIFR